MFPDWADWLKSTRMEFVPAPELIVAPAGSDQTYVTALGIGGTEYATPLFPRHTDCEPEIDPAWPGIAFTFTLNTVGTRAEQLELLS